MDSFLLTMLFAPCQRRVDTCMTLWLGIFQISLMFYEFGLHFFNFSWCMTLFGNNWRSYTTSDLRPGNIEECMPLLAHRLAGSTNVLQTWHVVSLDWRIYGTLLQSCTLQLNAATQSLYWVAALQPKQKLNKFKELQFRKSSFYKYWVSVSVARVTNPRPHTHSPPT